MAIVTIRAGGSKIGDILNLVASGRNLATNGHLFDSAIMYPASTQWTVIAAGRKVLLVFEGVGDKCRGRSM